jgi:hypothetical protein
MDAQTIEQLTQQWTAVKAGLEHTFPYEYPFWGAIIVGGVLVVSSRSLIPAFALIGLCGAVAFGILKLAVHDPHILQAAHYRAANCKALASQLDNEQVRKLAEEARCVPHTNPAGDDDAFPIWMMVASYSS